MNATGVASDAEPPKKTVIESGSLAVRARLDDDRDGRSSAH
jgi:hypothetical protein